MSITWHWDWAIFFGLLITYFPGTLLHELGHVALGWLAGSREPMIQYGHPKERFQTAFRLGPVRFQFHLGLSLWLHAPQVTFGTFRTYTPLQRLVVSLAGPAVSALLFAAFMPDTLADVVWLPHKVRTWQQMAQWWGLWGVVVPLFPLRYPSGMPSDGLRVIQATAALLGLRKPPTE